MSTFVPPTESASQLNNYIMIVLDVFMVFAPNIGFIAQIIKFRQVKSSEGFSKFLSFILLIANILRIFFWVGKRFTIALLFQSILMVIMQMILLKECLKYSNHDKNKDKEKSMGNNLVSITTNPYLYKPIVFWDMKNFWNWPYLLDYAYFLCLFTLILGFISNVIGFDNHFYVEFLGFASASVEAIIGVPQIIKSYSSKSTESLSSFMIYTWVVGDTFKIFYYINTNSPMQLICCGIFQLSMDLVILGQIFYYGSKGKSGKSLKSSKDDENHDLKLGNEIDFSNELEELHECVSII
jgi:solute carrier family 66, member 2